MRGTFSEIISASWEWTKTVLFRPFQVKKWLLLGFIALLAGQLSNGCNGQGNFNLPGGNSGPPGIKESGEGKTASNLSSNIALSIDKFVSTFKGMNKGLLICIIIPVFLFFILLFLFSTWLYSRFSFVFLESVVKNDASIKRPFRENKSLGNSYFLWNIAITLLSFAVMALLGLLLYLSLRKIGVFSQGAEAGVAKIVLVVLPFVIIFIVFGIMSLLLTFVLRNFILPVMYKDKLKILKAWPKVFSILKHNKGNAGLYLLIKIGLIIAVLFLAGFVGMLLMFGLLLPGGIIAGVIFLGYKIMPLCLQIPYIVVMVTIGIPVILAIGFCINCLFLPMPVFFQTFNLKFLARIDERYDLFTVVSKIT